MIAAQLLSGLTEPLHEEITRFCDVLRSVAIEQWPDGPEILTAGAQVRRFVGRDAASGHLVCYANINEAGPVQVRRAHIQFGPISGDIEWLGEALVEIHRMYRQEGFAYLSIQLGIPTGAQTDLLEARINQVLSPRYSFDAQNWSSLQIDLRREWSEIFRDYSKGHRSALKKAEKHGLEVVKVAGSGDEAEAFYAVYQKMELRRGLPRMAGGTTGSLRRICAYLTANNRGSLYVVKEKSGEVLGGIITVRQGTVTRYYKGAADPARREVPVLHAALHEAIGESHRSGMALFDLWGYNHYAHQGSQLWNINVFKRGFGGDFSFYPKIMHFELRPILWRAARAGRFIRDGVGRLSWKRSGKE